MRSTWPGARSGRSLLTTSPVPAPVPRLQVRVSAGSARRPKSRVVIADVAREGYGAFMSQDEKPRERRRMARPPTGGTAAGRGMGQKIRTADKKSLSSQQWIKRQLADKFSEKARAEGWR